MDVDDLIRQFWEAEHETDPKVAAKHLLGMIPHNERDEVLLTLLTHAYSSFASREGPRRKVRRSAPQNQAARGEAVARDLDIRPFYVPSKGIYVYFKDMTRQDWAEWASRRQRKADMLLTGIAWAKNILDLMGQHDVTVSGDLPPEVKEGIFSRGVPDLDILDPA